MPESILEYLAADHDRLERWLNEATAGGAIAMEPYEKFRHGILRHIGMEERILLPAIAQAQGGAPSADAERLRLDHGAIVALLVPPPDAAIIRTLKHILGPHNVLEEGERGVYRLLDTFDGPNTAALLAKMKAAGEVPVMPFNTKPDVLEVTRRALERAGYHLLGL
jgi:hypothetical protein